MYIWHCGFIIIIFLYSLDIEGAGAIDPSDEIANEKSKKPSSEKDSECQKDSSDDDLEMGECFGDKKNYCDINILNWPSNRPPRP